MWTQIPSLTIDECLTIFRVVFEKVRRTSKVTHMMGINASFWVMRVLFSGAPTGLVKKHIKKKSIISHVKICQLMVQIRTIQDACWNKIVFDTFVLKAVINDLNVLQIVQREAHKLKGWLASVKRNNQRPVKSVMAKDLQLLGIVVSGQSFLRTFHIQDVQKQIMLVYTCCFTVWISVCLERCSIQRKVWIIFKIGVFAKYFMPDWLIVV